jgi:hypothetical protein
MRYKTIGQRNFKTTEKSDRPVIVPCIERNCVYHEGSPPGSPNACYCSHPYKEKHLNKDRCPLFTLNWLGQQR